MRLHIPIRVRFADLDAYGHVNNAVLVTLLEEARIAAFWLTAHTPETVLPTAILDMRDGAPTAMLVARQEIEYLEPIPFFRRPLDLQLWICRIGSSSLRVCFEVRSPSGDDPATVYARAETIMVMVGSGDRPAPITEEQRAAWSPYLEDPVEWRDRRR